MKTRLIALPALAATAALLLSGCSFSENRAGWGESLSAGVDSASDDTKGRLTVTVSEPTKVPMSETELEFEGVTDGTLYYVNYTAKVEEGVYDPEDTYTFSSWQWQAELVSGGEISPVGIVSERFLPEECKPFDEFRAGALAAGQEIESCQIFVSNEDGEIKTVVFDRPQMSYKNRDRGYRWETPQG